MHDLGELILEGVANSFEAGADKVAIELRKSVIDDNNIDNHNGFFSIRIQDNGTLVEGNPYFENGFSTKKGQRGKGLALIHLVDSSARLYRQDGNTVLFFQAEDDGSLDNIEDVLFPIFQLDIRIEFRYLVDDKEILFLSREKGDRLQTIKEIAAFKQMIRLKIRSV